MASFYKYLPQNFAESFMSQGLIRIGTLYDYRNVEQHGDDIGDQSEGLKTVFSHDEEPKKGTELNPLESLAMKGVDSMTIENNRIEVRTNTLDCYVYSISKSYNASTPEKLSIDLPDGNYVSCIEITNIDMLIQEVDKVLLNVAFVGLGECQYIGREHHYATKTSPPVLLKAVKYKYQDEARLVWNPIGASDIEPQILKIDHVQRFCRLVNNNI